MTMKCNHYYMKVVAVKVLEKAEIYSYTNDISLLNIYFNC